MAYLFNKISGATALSDFRVKNDGSHIISLLKQNTNVLISWAVGVGKSFNMDSVTEIAITEQHYELVIVMLPTRALIDEREFIKSPPEDIKVMNIRPRPASQCGAKRNNDWTDYERRGLSLLGKKTLCDLCPKSGECFWPKQYGKASLNGSGVIYATQAHLKNNPNFISRMKEKSGASKVLVIFDEATVSLTSYSRTVTQEHLAQLSYAINESGIEAERKTAWTMFLDSLIKASTDDLRVPDVWAVPALFPYEVREVLTIGERSFGDDFHNITYDLAAFANSPLDAREKTEYGDIRFPATPLTAGCDVLLYSGTTDPCILSMRLGLDFHNPYEHYRFKGEDTRWLNIASSIGTSSNFFKNSAQILDFYLELALHRINQGKRVLLISKKKLSGYCIDKLNEMLTSRGIADIKVVTGDAYDEESPAKQIPLIHYGIIGINKFEQYDCAYCLNSYYTTEKILSNSIQDMRATDEHVDIEIKIANHPRRRYARVADSKYRYTDVAEAADPMLNTLEMGTVVQAVGRVRPFTHSREIITFQNGAVPNYPYDLEFSNLVEARQHFGIKTRRERKSLKQHESIQTLKAQGLKQKDIAEKLQLSSRTVRRYWHPEKADKTP